MSQYEVTAIVEYKYLVDANNEHEAMNIYMNDNDSTIPIGGGNTTLIAKKIGGIDSRLLED
jgi:hypothetical protein